MSKSMYFERRFSRLPTSDSRPRRMFFGMFVFILQLFFAGPIQSQTLDEYLRIAVENNPEVKVYFHEYQAAVEQIGQAGALPDPELSVGFFFKPMDRFMGRQQADIKLMQMFPWFGTPGVQREEADQMSRVRYEGFEEAKNRLFFEVKSKWYELYRQKEEIKILKENIEISKTYERLALIRFQNAGTGAASGSMAAPTENSSKGTAASMGGMSSGGGSSQTASAGKGGNSTSPVPSSPMNSISSGMSEVLKIRMQLKEMESDLEYLQDSEELSKAEFNKLLNRDLHEEVVVADSIEGTQLVVERMALLDSITSNNPMLKMLDAEIGVYGSQREMARFEGRPMLGVGVNYMPFAPREADGMTMGGKDMVMPMISITLPVYRKKYKAMAKEAELNQLAVVKRKENTFNDLALRWRGSLVDFDDALRKATLYKEQTALARQTLKLLLAGYSTNGQGFEDVLQMQQELLNYQLKLVEVVVKQHTSIAMLEMLAATELVE